MLWAETWFISWYNNTRVITKGLVCHSQHIWRPGFLKVWVKSSNIKLVVWVRRRQSAEVGVEQGVWDLASCSVDKKKKNTEEKRHTRHLYLGYLKWDPNVTNPFLEDSYSYGQTKGKTLNTKAKQTEGDTEVLGVKFRPLLFTRRVLWQSGYQSLTTTPLFWVSVNQLRDLHLCLNRCVKPRARSRCFGLRHTTSISELF